ncbi:hypothetical protein BDA96_07G118300 [Sorghum bicolor]|uniref:Uncharacterized protein n=2 Tax=Sorghum bicolor TaxID=4558 RepID=A0A921UA99_SORBI|nr:hypothetical protein BDA96_07G118300 [Sorghum bicolor]KXG25025.1 hypothetical protein SORBI_3007G111400 [Sorghum bicolor]
MLKLTFPCTCLYLLSLHRLYGCSTWNSEHFLVTHVIVFSPMCLSLLEHTFSFLSNFFRVLCDGKYGFLFLFNQTMIIRNLE